MKEKGVVMTSLSCPMLRACNVTERAAVPEAVEMAYFVPQYWANSSSNLNTLSPMTIISFSRAERAAAFISASMIGDARCILLRGSPRGRLSGSTDIGACNGAFSVTRLFNVLVGKVFEGSD